MESFTSNNIAELCRRHGVSIASIHKGRDKFIGNKFLEKTGKGKGD